MQEKHRQTRRKKRSEKHYELTRKRCRDPFTDRKFREREEQHAIERLQALKEERTP